MASQRHQLEHRALSSSVLQLEHVAGHLQEDSIVVVRRLFVEPVLSFFFVSLFSNGSNGRRWATVSCILIEYRWTSRFRRNNRWTLTWSISVVLPSLRRINRWSLSSSQHIYLFVCCSLSSLSISLSIGIGIVRRSGGRKHDQRWKHDDAIMTNDVGQRRCNRIWNWKPCVLRIACLTISFVIYWFERPPSKHRPILILVETFDLPPTCTGRFDLFISLFRSNLSMEKITSTWDPLQAELFEFIPFGLFDEDEFNLPDMSKTSIQNDLQWWYNRVYPHSVRCLRYDNRLDPDDDDDDRMMTDDFWSCRCLHLMRGLDS